MARRTATVGAIAYTIADDDPPRPELLPRAVLRTAVIDELTLRPVDAPLSVTTNLRGAWTRVASGGICGLAARPVDVVAALAHPGGFTASVSAPGYLPRDLTPDIDGARRTLVAGTAAGASSLSVAPGDPTPRAQFRPGRAVVIEREAPPPPPAPVPEEEVAEIDAVPPPSADVVSLMETLRSPHSANRHVAGLPIVLPVQRLHRDGTVRIRGQVRRKIGPSIVPAPGASVAIAGIWWDHPSSITSPPKPPDLCAVSPSLRLAHPVGAPVHTCTFNTGSARALGRSIPAGALEIEVAPNSNLVPAGGDVLRLGDPATDDHEIVVSDGFAPATDPNAPVVVRLRTPTGLLHRAGEPIHRMQAAVSANPVGSVGRESLPGDLVLFATGLNQPLQPEHIVVEPTQPHAVYYRALRFPTTNGANPWPLDVEGRFVWPPIARVAEVRVITTLPAHPTVQIDHALDPGGDSSLAIVLT